MYLFLNWLIPFSWCLASTKIAGHLYGHVIANITKWYRASEGGDTCEWPKDTSWWTLKLRWRTTGRCRADDYTNHHPSKISSKVTIDMKKSQKLKLEQLLVDTQPTMLKLWKDKLQVEYFYNLKHIKSQVDVSVLRKLFNHPVPPPLQSSNLCFSKTEQTTNVPG